MTDEPTYDYGKDSSALGDNALARIAGLAQDQIKAEAEVARLEEELKAAQAKLKDISQFKLPELLAEVGMSEFKLKDGTKISVKEDVRASIPKSDSQPAFDWLESHGSGALIKREIKISFGKGEEAWAKKFMADLAKRKKPVKAENKMTVHPQTLQAFIREQLEKGETVPLDIFGAFIQKFTKVVLPDGASPAKSKGKSDADLF